MIATVLWYDTLISMNRSGATIQPTPLTKSASRSANNNGAVMLGTTQTQMRKHNTIEALRFANDGNINRTTSRYSVHITT